MTDIVLIQPPVEDFYFTYKRSIPYGLASIAASLQKQGFSVEIIDCLAVKKSKIIEMPQEMEYLLPYYGKHDISIFSIFNQFRHYGYSYEHAAAVTRDKKPFLVGISSLFTPYCHAAEKMALLVKKILPDCKIVMGGHHPTVLPHEVMKCSAVDFILRGEGEISMPLLAQFLSKQVVKSSISIKDIPGIVFRKQEWNLQNEKYILISKEESVLNSHDYNLNGSDYCLKSEDQSIHISEPAWIDDFSRIPPPAMDLVNHLFYSRSKKTVDSKNRDSLILSKDKSGNTVIADSNNRRGSTVMVAGRGCPMPCTYCSVGASSSHGRFRQRQVRDVIDELSVQIEKYDIGFIDFEDENLTLNRKWFLELMDEIIRLSCAYDEESDSNLSSLSGSNMPHPGSIELRAMNGLYPPSLDEEMIIRMKIAGFKTLNLSLGSTSSEQLRRFKRPDVRKSFELVLEIAERHGMETVSYIIAGAPYQKVEDSLDDLVFLAQKRTLVGLSIFYPAPGSADYELCRKEELLPDKFSLMRSSALPIHHTTSRIQSVTLLRLVRVLNFMKMLVNEGIAIPEPEPYKDEDLSFDRKRAGISLIKSFFHDGKLRGIDSNGAMFEHNVDRALCMKFVEKIKNIHIR